MKEPRTEQGKFAAKSDSERKVRSIRATDRVWDDFGFEADKRRITRADLLEMWAGEPPQSAATDERPGRGDVAAALAVLEAALTMRANAGGAIKAEIRRAITLLE